MKPETKQKSKKAFDIISFILVFLLFICSLLCLIARFNGAKFDLFGNRYDVVLTNSMSEVNPKHAEELAPYSDRYKAFDLVVSRALPSEVETDETKKIKKGDVVLYTDRYIGTNMHRVVDIRESYYEQIYFKSATRATVDNHTGVTLDEISSQIYSNDIRFETMTITTYSTLEESNNFNFFVTPKLYTPEISRESSGSGYLTTYKITRDTKSPGELKISHNAVYDYTKEIIVGMHIDSFEGTIDVNFTNDLIDSNDIPHDLLTKYNNHYEYLIRGDAAKDSDGWYSYKELQSKVTGNMPGMGYPIRFMGSIWGGLMFALLALLILVTDIIITRIDKKEAEKANADASKKPEEVKPAPVPTAKPVEPVKKAAVATPVVNVTIKTVKQDPNDPNKKEVISTQTVQVKAGDNKTITNNVDVKQPQVNKSAPQPVKKEEPKTVPQPVKKAENKPVSPAPSKPNNNGSTTLRKSGSNEPPKGDKK